MAIPLAASASSVAAQEAPDPIVSTEAANAPAPAADAAPANVADAIARDPLLRDALDRAVATNPNALSARANARAAGHDVKNARWQRFPGLSLDILEVSQQRPGLPYNKFYPTVSVEQPIWTAGRINGSIRQAKAARDVALSRYAATALDIATEVVSAYFDLVRLNEREVILVESLARHQEMVATIERRVAAEVSPLVDLDLARSRLSQISQQVSIAQAQRLAALQRLRDLVGDPEEEAGKVDTPDHWPVIDLAQAQEEARQYSPRLQALRGEAQVSATDLQLAQSNLMPQVSGVYSYNDYQGSKLGVVVRMQTGRGLSRFSSIDAARARKEASQADIVAGERDLSTRIASDQSTYASATARLGEAQRDAEAAKRIHESYLRQFVSGRRSWLDVMNSVQELTSATLNVADTRASALSSLNRLLLETGRWRLDIEKAN